jgi:hypothetical protein
MKWFSILLLSMAACSVCSAGEGVGTVRFEHGQYASSPTSAGMTFFYLDGGGKVGTPACSTWAGGQRWVINNNWPGAKIQLSILIAAKMSGRSVRVYGSGDCGVWGDTETAWNLFME